MRSAPRSMSRSARTMRKSESHMLVLPQFIGHNARAQIDLAVDQRGHVAGVMEDADNGDALALEIGEAAEEGSTRAGIERSGGLVKQQELLRQDQCARQVHLLLFATRK